MTTNFVQPDNIDEKPSFFRRMKNLIIGKAKNPNESGVFHKLALIAFFAGSVSGQMPFPRPAMARKKPSAR